jgi:D-amino-acid dehydrogenase
MRWLVERDSPLRVLPHFEPSYLWWLLRFAASCSSAAAEAGLRSTLALNAQTSALFEGLQREAPELEINHRGVLVVYRRLRSFADARKKFGHLPGVEILSRQEALALEPLVRRSACAGAMRYAAERHVRPDLLIAALVGCLKRLGVEVRPRTQCLELIHDGCHVVAVRTADGDIDASICVLAAGANSSALARRVGVRLPVEAGRGYSFDVARDQLPLRGPVYLYDARLALTPFNDTTRVAGMMELGARTATVRPRAIASMHRAGATSFEAWPTDALEEAWAGLRPMTPDGLPVIGLAHPFDNLYIAGGHGMLGLTLSLRTGEAIAEGIVSGSVDPAVQPFTPTRFANRRHRPPA